VLCCCFFVSCGLIHSKWITVPQPFYLYSDGWRSAVGRSPVIDLPTSTTAGRARYSKLDITIDRFGQEEDATGASFVEPITYLVDRDVTRSSRQVSRSLSKQSDAAQLSNSFSKLRRQQVTADKPLRSYKFGTTCTGGATVYSLAYTLLN